MSNVTIPAKLFKNLLVGSTHHPLALLEPYCEVNQDWANGKTYYRFGGFTVIEEGNSIVVENHQRIFVWCEHTIAAGNVCKYDENDVEQLDWIENTDAAYLWGFGTRDDLIKQAIERLSNNYGRSSIDNRFMWKCAKNVLEYLDGPEVKYDPKNNIYVVDEEEDAE
jgi:hypothetical protein